MLECRKLVDHQRIELPEEACGLLREPLRCIGVRNVDVGVVREGLLALFGRAYFGPDMGSELAEVILPSTTQQGLGGDDKHAPASAFAALGEELNLYAGLAGSGIGSIEGTMHLVHEQDTFDLVRKQRRDQGHGEESLGTSSFLHLRIYLLDGCESHIESGSDLGV